MLCTYVVIIMVDFQELNICKKSCTIILCAHAAMQGHLCVPKAGGETPTVSSIAGSASSTMTSPWHPATNRVFVVSKSRIPKRAQPVRPSSAVEAAPSRISMKFNAPTKAISSNGRSLLPLPEPSSRGSMNASRSLHSSVSSLTSMGSGKAPHSQSKTRHGSLLDGQHDKMSDFSAKGRNTKGHGVSPSNIPQFAQVRCMSAMGHASVPKDYDVPMYPALTHSKISDVSPTTCKVSFSPYKNMQNPYSRSMSPCIQISLAKFDVGRL